MALIGEMRYLTIGNNTYSLPSSGGSGTVSNVAVSNATNGGLTVSGSPITSSGTITIGHSNVLNSAQTTSAVYPIKIDKNGHISEYGSAVSITDEKLKVGTTTVGTQYYPVLTTSTTTAETKKYDENFSFLETNSALSLWLSVSGKTSSITLGSTGSYPVTLSASPDGYTGMKVLYLPDITETTATLATIENIPSITLNGNSTTSPNFYAPTGAGTSGYVLKSNGSGAPTWTSATLTDENLKWTASTTSNTYYPLVSTSTATTSTANTINGVDFYQYYNTAGGYRRLDLGNTTAYKSTGGAYGTIRLYGAAATYYGDLVPGVLGTTSGDGHISANRTWTLPDKTGTIALTSDLPSVPSITLNGSASTSPSFYAPTGAGTNGYVLKSNGSGAPTWTSAVLTDENVTSTAVTAATTNYIVGSTTSTTTTGTLSKHASAVMYTTADSGTSGYTQLRLGNTTATTSAGGKEGQIRLYGTGATYYVDIKAGAIASSNKTITFPNATGTVALTSDIPTVPTITLNGSSTTSPSFYAPTSAGTSGYYLKSNGSGAPTWAAVSTGGVTDVTVGGTSVVTSGVAAIASPVQIVRW